MNAVNDPIVRLLLGNGSGEIGFWSVLVRILCSALLAAVIGTERSSKRHSAGLRTFMLVSLAGTIAMMKAAMEGAVRSDGTKPLVVAITQLTSTTPDALKNELLINESMENTVIKYAQNVQAAGLSGIVCSPLEVVGVKKGTSPDFITITPGIRPADAKKDDQARFTTPAQAAKNGSDYIVGGRPITRAEDPVAAYTKIYNEFMGL